MTEQPVLEEDDAYNRADKASLITEEERQAYTVARDRIRAEYLVSREHRPPTATSCLLLVDVDGAPTAFAVPQLMHNGMPQRLATVSALPACSNNLVRAIWSWSRVTSGIWL